MHREYSYTNFCPLANLSEDIRVLEIIDSTSGGIECNLVQNPPGEPYATLSWCWGTPAPEDMTTIRIFHQNLPYEFDVPKNLESAMLMLRHHKQFRVWIDFICIDQNNMHEKNYQVPMMFQIYGQAERVYVWLGEEDEGSRMAMEFIENRVLNLRDFDRLIRDEKAVQEWKALSALMKRQWFSRRWIVQEIAIAQSATLLCGKHKVEWKDLADAISLFNEVEKSTRKISEVMKLDRELGHIPDFGDVSELSATKLVEETKNLFRKLGGEDREPQFNLEYLVSKLTTFESSQPRDAIYALVAIARDTRPVTTRLEKEAVRSWTYPEYIKEKLIGQLARKNVSKPYHVDYNLPLSDVYTQFVRWAIDKSEKSRALNIICRPWAPELAPSDYPRESHFHYRIKTKDDKRPQGEGIDTLPSWIPTVGRAAFGMDGTGKKMTRKNADSLVGLPPRRIYRAAGTRVLTDNFRMEDGITRYSQDEDLNGLHYHSMFVEGFILDNVKQLYYPSQQGNIPKDWLRSAKDQNGQLSDEFWRTIVVDRSPSGDNAPRYYPRLVDHALKQGVRGDSLNTKDLVNWGNCTIVGEVLRRVQSSIWNRRLVRTEGQRFGLAPELADREDLICILYGCSVPVLLRKFTKMPEEVAEEDRQRQEKKEKLEEKRMAEAAKKIWQVWRDISARRKEKQPNPSKQLEPSKQPDSPRQTRNLGKRSRASEGPGSLRKKQKQARPSNSAPGPASRQHPSYQNQPPSAKLDTDRKPIKVKVESDPNVYYQLIGECYIDGMMNGEALMRSHRSMLFEIR